MAEIDKQSRLDKEGIEYRSTRIPGKNKYIDEINPYDENSDDARHHDDPNHPWGKGTGKSMGYAVRDLTKPKTHFNYSNVDTRTEAGGSYDIYGTKGVEGAFQGDAGRDYAKKLNIYSPENAYGKDSVNIDESVRGQYVNIDD
jgi:hypothetical protein